MTLCYLHNGAQCHCQPSDGKLCVYDDRHRAIAEIWKIVHTPTRDTKHKGAADHFAADFDAIRRICAPFVHEETRRG